MVKKLQKVGNSRALIIERPLMDALGINDDTPLQLTVSGSTLIVSPADVGIGPASVKKSIAKARKRYGRMLKRLAR